MKRRIRKVVNFFAFNLLFFALYLNFIHKDKPNIIVTPAPAQVGNTAALSGTVLVTNPEKYLDHKDTKAQGAQGQETHPEKADGPAASKVSVN